MTKITLGHRAWRSGEGTSFELEAPDRRHHVYVVGKTGAGKSTLLKNMAVQDMKNGRGLAVVDPHGDLAEDLLNFIPKNRLNDIIYFNPADTRHPAGINILEAENHEEKQMVASSLVSVFRHLWRDSWGPRTEYLLYNAVLALMDTPGQTLLGVHRILIDKAFRARIIRKVEDPLVRGFWLEVFSRYSEHFASEVISPIQNKIGQLLTSSYIRNIVGQPKSTIDLKFAIGRGQIIIANLSKGKIGEDRANLLGSVLITKLYLAALERQKIPEEARKDFYLYADEFQNFTTDVFPSILSEARKYRLNLTLAHQYLDQVPENIRQSVFGNVGTWIIFRVGSSDAGLLEKEFAPYYDLESMRKQKNYEFIYKTLRDGSVSDPSSSKILPPAGREGIEASREIVIKVSRERFTRKREIVERKILRWFGEKPKLDKISHYKKS